MRVRELAQPVEEARRGRHHAHVAGHRLHDHRRDLRRRGAANSSRDRVEVVERHRERSARPAPPARPGCRGRRRSRRPSPPSRAGCRRGRGSSRRTSRCRSRPVAPRATRMRAHRGLGARADQPHHLHRRARARAISLGHLDLERGRRAVAGAAPGRLGDRLDHRAARRGRGSAGPTSRRSRCTTRPSTSHEPRALAARR